LPPPDTSLLLLVTAAGVALVVLLITWARLPAFIALAAGGFFVGLAARMPVADIPRAFQQGVGDTLGFIAIVIGLGTIIGKLLAESGGALVVARALVRALGERRVDWAVMLSAFIIGLPVFFPVGLVLLAPVVFTLVKQTSTPLLRLGIPLVAALSAAHGLVPPHPGPLAAIERLGADTGRTLFYSLLVGLPCAIAAGPLFARLIARRVDVAPGAMAEQLTDARPEGTLPSLAATLATILLPVALMMLAAVAQTVMGDGPARAAVVFAGNPLVAMFLATLLSFITFGRWCGLNLNPRAAPPPRGLARLRASLGPQAHRARLLRFAEESIPPVASVLLVVGAGGGFGRVLDAAGADTAIAHGLGGMQLSPLVLGWTIAALLRLAVGSATVAVVTAASIIAPVAQALPLANKDLLVVAIGAGSVIASHVNDGGFWLVKEYLNMNVPQTVATWTALETIIAVTGLAAVLLLDAIV
jgi:GntP family gluconate:H+ symporter